MNIEDINNLTKQAYSLGAQKYHDLFHNEMNEKEFDRKLLDMFSGLLGSSTVICDAGCGPSGHIGKYLFDKGHPVYGIDISDKCIELARKNNPELIYTCADIADIPFDDDFFDGIISYYSIIDTPKEFVSTIFKEFRRVLQPGGLLLTAVKEGNTEGIINDFLGYKTEIYFTLFTIEEMKKYYADAGFKIEFIERRNPYDFEIHNDRIFAIGKKI